MLNEVMNGITVALPFVVGVGGVGVLASGYVKASPDTALIISGLRKKPKVLMIEGEETCLDIARQLAAVESAVTAAKRVLIHDHIDHCLSHDEDSVLAEMKALTRLL